MKVKVLRKHIRAGCPQSAVDCPIALALIDDYGEAEVNEDNVKIRGFCFKLPRKARIFVERFDAEKDVDPFSFELRTLCE